LLAADALAQLDRHLAYARMRGIRMPDAEGLLSDPRLGHAVAAMGERGLSLEADVPPERMPELSALADRFPRTSFALGHVGVPDERSPEYLATWRAALHEVAKRDNIAVKISGLGMRDPRWTVESIRPYVLEAIDAFGVGRCMFGTNWPVDRLYSDLPALVNAYRTLISDLGEQAQRDLLLHNAERFYRMTG
jgi:predicted TIM-barrel fold metal-dependent hydrolase